MCIPAGLRSEPETLFTRCGATWAADAHRPNRDPVELYPKSDAYIVRKESGRRFLDVMSWDVLGGAAPWPMTNVRNLKLPRWQALAAKPEQRCLIPLTEFAEWTPDKHQIGVGKPIKGRCGSASPTSRSSPWRGSGSGPRRATALPWSPAIRTSWSRRSTRRR